MSSGPLRVPVEPLEAGPRKLVGDTARYVLRVHRLSAGDVFVAFDPTRAIEADARILSTSKDDAAVEIGPLRPARVVAPRRITLFQGLPKGDKMDAIVRDATELGATRVVPVVLARSVAQHKSDAAVERWRRVALEAARQSGRGDVPEIERPTTLDEALRRTEGVGVVLSPLAPTPFGRVVAAHRDGALSLLVGPEGGLDPKEIEVAERAGLVSARLGRLVLRTETACAAALGAILGVEGDHEA